MDENKIKLLEEYKGDDSVITSHALKLKLATEKTNITRALCGINGIDFACEGFCDGELIVISGPTKNGKTLLCQSFTHHFAKNNKYPLWFSFEVPARQFLDQFPDLPLMYMPQKLRSRAMDWFEDRCMEGFIKFNTRIIFIDHLHYLIDLARVRQSSLEIGTIIRRLKTFAVENNFVIFLLCHTTKGKHEGVLSYESIRDSSFVSQESDTVIMVCRTPIQGENTSQARIEFHRRTGVMERVVKLVKVNGLLVEREDDYDER